MSRFDRYLLSHLLALFGFFSLVLVAIYWINRAVVLFETLIGDGQTALVFLEFSLLTLPNVIRLVLPISAFAATVYGINRLMADQELVVMQATGFSAFRLARPVFYFGLLVALMVAVLVNILVPASRGLLDARSAEIAENVSARFLVDGQFLHPSDGITLYIRQITPNGELRDVFINDSREAGREVTYTASRALLVKGETAPKLVMLDGMVQAMRPAGMGPQSAGEQRLSLTRFDDFTYDLVGLIKIGGSTRRSLDELSTRDLLRADPAVIAETGKDRAAFLYEGHYRIAQPLLATAAAMLGFSALLLGAFSRFGLWRQILFAVLLLIAMQVINTAATKAVLSRAEAWPLTYLAPIFGLATAVLILWISQRPRRRRAPNRSDVRVTA